jgi:hypothetical protein
MTTLTSPPRLFDLPLERERVQTAKTEQGKEEAAGQCSARPVADDAAMRRFAAVCSDGGRLTLEQRLDRVWEGLSAAGVSACPVCDGKLEARTAVPGGICRRCGSTLS